MRRRPQLILIVACGALPGACADSPSSIAPLETEVRAYSDQTPGAPDQVERWARDFQFASFTASSGKVVPYRLLRAKAAGRLPLVVVLHGSGAMGSDNRSQLGPFAAAWAQPGVGSAIVAVPQVADRSADYGLDADGLPASRAGPSFRAVEELVDALSRDRGVDPHRIHLVGFSMGASAALQLALMRPLRFASVTAFAPVPPARALASAFRGQRLTVIHGDADTENPFVADQAWVAALRKVGAKPRFIVYRGMDHRVPPDMLTSPAWRSEIVAARR